MTRIVEKAGVFYARLQEHPGHNQRSHGRKFSTMAADTDRWGGTSVDYVGRKPKSGYMVGGIAPSKALPAGSTRSQVREGIRSFVDEHRATLRKPGHYIGTWKDTDGDGRVWIDISQRVGTLSKARAVGQSRNEIAVFNVRTMDSVNIGGTGNAE